MLYKPILKCAFIFLFAPCLSFGIPGQASSVESGHKHHHHTAAEEPTVDMEILPEALIPGAAATISFTFKDPDGNPVKNLAIVHDRILHVIIVGEDLSTFAHIHPEDFGSLPSDAKEKGSFSVRYTFPKAGKYLIAADYAIGSSHFSEQFSAEAAGGPKMAPPARDLSREKTFGPYSVVFNADPKKIKAGKKTVITFSIKKDGKKVKDIVPYLSAAMHVAAVSSDLNHFIHAHGDIPGSASEDHAGHHADIREAYGPDIETGIFFPSRGLYRIFSEFKHEGRVVLLDFMVEVE